ncbi:MAG: RDD family protein [Mangrovibacterium sp.]
MSDIKIQTAQNTVLLQDKAGLGERMLASLIDLGVIAGYIWMGALIMLAFSHKPGFWLVYSLPVFFFTLVQELFFHGQTIGKKVMKLKVVHLEGREVPVSSYLLRWLLRIVDIWILFGSIGTLTIILSRNGQRIGDLAANTVVVSIKDNPNFSDLFYNTQGEDNEHVVFSQARLLRDQDIEIIREVLSFGKANGYSGKAGGMVRQTSNSIKKKLSIETDMKPVQFLEQLLKDYAVLFR